MRDVTAMLFGGNLVMAIVQLAQNNLHLAAFNGFSACLCLHQLFSYRRNEKRERTQ